MALCPAGFSIFTKKTLNIAGGFESKCQVFTVIIKFNNDVKVAASISRPRCPPAKVGLAAGAKGVLEAKTAGDLPPLHYMEDLPVNEDLAMSIDLELTAWPAWHRVCAPCSGGSQGQRVCAVRCTCSWQYRGCAKSATTLMLHCE